MALKKVGVEFEAKIKKYQEQIKEAVASTEKGHAKIISALIRTEKAALKLAATEETSSARVKVAQERVEQAIKKTSNAKELATLKVKKAEQQLRRESIKTEQAQRRLAASMDRTSKASNRQSKSIGALTKKMGGWLAAAVSISEFTQLEDAWLKAEVQIDATTDSMEESRNVQSKLLKIANELGVSYTDLSNVFGRFKRATSELGTTSEDIIAVTENISKALLLEGNSANEVNSVIIQLSQGLRAGILAGDEFRAVSESSSIILKALAAQMGVAVKDLKKLGSQGKITAETLIEATKNMEVSGDALEKATSTWAATWERVRNGAGKFNDGLQELIPISDFFKNLIEIIAKSMLGWGLAFDSVGKKLNNFKTNLKTGLILVKAFFESGFNTEEMQKSFKKARDEIKKLKKELKVPRARGDPEELERIEKLRKAQEKSDIARIKGIEARLSKAKKSRQSDLKNLEETKKKELDILGAAGIRTLTAEFDLKIKINEINQNFEERKKGASKKAIQVLNKNQIKELAIAQRSLTEQVALSAKINDLKLALIEDFESQKEAIAEKARNKEDIAFDKEIEAQQKELDAERKKTEAIERIKDEAAQREVERIESRLERSRQSRQNDLENLEETLETESVQIEEAINRGILSRSDANALLLDLEVDFLSAKEELALTEEEKLVKRLELELEMYQELNNQKLISDEVLFAAKEKLEFEQIKTVQDTAIKAFQSKLKLNSAEFKFVSEGLDFMSQKSEKAAKAQFFIKKAQKLSEAFVSTAAGIAEALPNFPLAIAVGIAGGAQIAAIASQSFGGGGGSAPAASGGDIEEPEQETSTEITTSFTDISGGGQETTRLIISLEDGTDLIDGIAERLKESNTDGRI